MKLTPSFFAVRSSVLAILTKSDGFRHEAAPTRATGVMEIRLLTTGTPISRPIASPVFTRSLA